MNSLHCFESSEHPQAGGDQHLLQGLTFLAAKPAQSLRVQQETGEWGWVLLDSFSHLPSKALSHTELGARGGKVQQLSGAAPPPGMHLQQ